MFDIEIEKQIKAPAGAVFAYLADFANNPEWQSSVISTVWTSEPPIRVGSTYRQTIDYRDQTTTYEVTSLQPGRSITVQSGAEAEIPTEVTRTVEAIAEKSCVVRVRLVGRPRGWRRAIQRTIIGTIRRSLDLDYITLQRRFERAED